MTDRIALGHDASLDSTPSDCRKAIGGTASMIPAILERERFLENIEKFTAEYLPQGPTEHALVRELARQSTAMERWGEAAESTERNAARNLPDLAKVLADGSADLLDTVLSGAMATETAQKCEKLSLARNKAFFRTLCKLEEVQEKRKARSINELVALPPPFQDDAACAEYLAKRLQDGSYRCTACDSTSGCFLASRGVWECHKCRKQFGLRSGTVMSGSSLSLFGWCEAIRWLLWRPTISTVELAERIRIHRLSTVRSMARRIRDAMAADDASVRLAGLDRYFARPTDNLS